jgi:hypothetical protein
MDSRILPGRIPSTEVESYLCCAATLKAKPVEHASRSSQTMTRTRLLVIILALVVLIQVFPDRARLIEVLILGGTALYCAVWAARVYSPRLKEAAKLKALAASDEAEYRQYALELQSIRAKYDPDRDFEDPTSISQEYKDELSALHDRHEAMLQRKFGPRS